MQIHSGIWAWFIRLLQSACPQQDSVVRIKGYTIWKRSICHLSLTLPFSPDDCQIGASPASLMKAAACLMYVNLNIPSFWPAQTTWLLLFTTPCVCLPKGRSDLIRKDSWTVFNMLFKAGLKSHPVIQVDNTYRLWMSLGDTGLFLASCSNVQTFYLLSVVQLPKYYSSTFVILTGADIWHLLAMSVFCFLFKS